MKLYSGSTAEFIHLNRRNQLADRLRKEFFTQIGYNPSDNEVMSWRNSLMRVALVLEDASLSEQGIFVEYQLPQSSKRIDVILCGKGDDNRKNSVIIELKQWERCALSDYESDYVVTWVGGGNRNVLHPSVQVGNYMYYLSYNHTAFYEGTDPVKLHACSYLHNYSLGESDPLLDSRFEAKYSRFPIFSQDDHDELVAYLKSRIGSGGGMAVLAEVEKSQYRPSKKLLEHVSTVIREKLEKGDAYIFSRKDDYVLLDEQLVVYDTVFSLATKGGLTNERTVIIVKGGPGTGKSVIALKLMADLAEKGKNAQYATGSRSFTETLRRIINVKGNSLFKYSSASAPPRGA